MATGDAREGAPPQAAPRERGAREEREEEREEREEREGKGKGKRKRKRKGSAARSLRHVDESFAELRFEPKTTARDLGSVLLMSFGALALGAGIYAQFFWHAEPAPSYAPLLLVAGLGLLVGYGFYGVGGAEPLVVGELGIGLEQHGRVTRLSWYQIAQVKLAHEALVVESGGKPLSLPLRTYPSGVRRVLRELHKRLPERIALDDAALATLAEPGPDPGERQPADPPQVTELFCRATHRALSMERDVRMCARCCVLYHRSGVPARCLECGATLR